MQFRKGDVDYVLWRILSRRRDLLPVGQIYANHSCSSLRTPHHPPTLAFLFIWQLQLEHPVR